MIPYAWDSPSASNKKLRLYSKEDSREIDILEIGNLVPFKFRTSKGMFTVSLDVRAENGSQMLSISNYVEEFSLYRPRLRRQSTMSKTDTLTGLEAFETVATEEVKPSLTVNVNLEGIGLSLINKRAIELLYLSSSGIKFEYMDSEAAQTVNLTLESIQLDNQLHDAIFPVVLQPTPLPKNEKAALTNLPAVQASVMVLKDECSHFNNFSSALSSLTCVNSARGAFHQIRLDSATSYDDSCRRRFPLCTVGFLKSSRRFMGRGNS